MVSYSVASEIVVFWYCPSTLPVLGSGELEETPSLSPGLGLQKWFLILARNSVEIDVIGSSMARFQNMQRLRVKA